MHICSCMHHAHPFMFKSIRKSKPRARSSAISQSSHFYIEMASAQPVPGASFTRRIIF